MEIMSINWIITVTACILFITIVWMNYFHRSGPAKKLAEKVTHACDSPNCARCQSLRNGDSSGLRNRLQARFEAFCEQLSQTRDVSLENVRIRNLVDSTACTQV